MPWSVDEIIYTVGVAIIACDCCVEEGGGKGTKGSGID